MRLIFVQERKKNAIKTNIKEERVFALRNVVTSHTSYTYIVTRRKQSLGFHGEYENNSEECYVSLVLIPVSH